MAVVKVTARPDPGLGLTARQPQGQQRDVALRPPADACELRVQSTYTLTLTAQPVSMQI